MARGSTKNMCAPDDNPIPPPLLRISYRIFRMRLGPVSSVPNAFGVRPHVLILMWAHRRSPSRIDSKSNRVSTLP